MGHEEWRFGDLPLGAWQGFPCDWGGSTICCGRLSVVAVGPWAGSERVAACSRGFVFGWDRREEPKIERIARARYHPGDRRWWDPGSSTTTTPAKRNARSRIRRSDAGNEETTLETIVKSRVIKLALTLGALATALLAGAANLRVG